MKVAAKRQELTDALKLATVDGQPLAVYTDPPETPTPPAVALVPDDPYLEPVAIGRQLNARVRLRLTAFAAPLDNAGALDTLEQLLVAIWSALPDGVEVGSASRPGLVLAGPTELLTATFDVALYADLTP